MFQIVKNNFFFKMERTNGYLVCTFCKRRFFTKLGFKIHKNEEHQQEEVKSIESTLEDKKDNCLPIFSTSDEKEKDLLKSEGNLDSVVDKTLNDNRVFDDESLQDESKKMLLIMALEVTATTPKKYKNSCFQCKICNKVFTTKIELQQHVEQGHEKNEHFQFKENYKELTVKNSLKSHKKAIRNKFKPFQCQECDKKFTF